MHKPFIGLNLFLKIAQKLDLSLFNFLCKTTSSLSCTGKDIILIVMQKGLDI